MYRSKAWIRFIFAFYSNYDRIYSRFGTIHERDGHQPDRLLVLLLLHIAPSRETAKALRHGSRSVTCNYTNVCLYLVNVHQMAPLQTEVANI